jgi:crotonobetainyl-CoA:carnitine CoA-transferase CaiB-like acyl-CoA transferase
MASLFGDAASTAPPPISGADTEAVLREIGYSTGEISGLREAGIV